MNDKRIHDLSTAGAGDAGNIDNGEPLGPCPSCGAELIVALAKHPRTQHVASVLMHPIPFCTYYGETDPVTIERDVERAKKEN